MDELREWVIEAKWPSGIVDQGIPPVRVSFKATEANLKKMAWLFRMNNPNAFDVQFSEASHEPE